MFANLSKMLYFYVFTFFHLVFCGIADLVARRIRLRFIFSQSVFILETKKNKMNMSYPSFSNQKCGFRVSININLILLDKCTSDFGIPITELTPFASGDCHNVITVLRFHHLTNVF